jgi:hypothetical protein
MKARTSVHKLVFNLIRPRTRSSSTNTDAAPSFPVSSLRSRALTSFQPGYTPTPAPSGEVPLCMVHKAAQEASRRMTPARALAHAVAPPLDRTFAAW